MSKKRTLTTTTTPPKKKPQAQWVYFVSWDQWHNSHEACAYCGTTHYLAHTEDRSWSIGDNQNQVISIYECAACGRETVVTWIEKPGNPPFAL
jgi:ribosomal protein S27AE